MSVHPQFHAQEAADRLAIRELVDAYATCADTRDAQGQMALFAQDCDFIVYMDGRNSEPTYALKGRDALAPVFDNLRSYQATTHFNGQSTVTMNDETATGLSYCIAHHVSVEGEKKSLMVASIRYFDRFAKQDGQWLFAERKLCVDWVENRTMNS